MAGLGVGSHVGGLLQPARRRPPLAAPVRPGRARHRRLRRAQLLALLRPALPEGVVAVLAGLARGHPALRRAVRPHVPDGDVAAVPRPRAGGRGAHRGADDRPPLRDQPARRGLRRRAHAVGAHPALRHPRRRPVRGGGQRGRGSCSGWPRAGFAPARARPRTRPARRRGSTPRRPRATASPSGSRSYGLTGFCALALEILWFRVLEMAVKSTAFTFGTVLALYLLGLGPGLPHRRAAGGPPPEPAEDVPRPAVRAARCTRGSPSRCSSLLPPDTPGYTWYVALLGEGLVRPRAAPGSPSSSGTCTSTCRPPSSRLPTVLMGLSFPTLQRAVHDDLRDQRAQGRPAAGGEHRGLRGGQPARRPRRPRSASAPPAPSAR